MTCGHRHGTVRDDPTTTATQDIGSATDRLEPVLPDHPDE